LLGDQITVFDTNIIIDFLNGYTKAKDIIEKYSGLESAAITSITGYELVKGLKEENKTMLLAFLEKVKIYNLDMKSSWMAGEFYKDLKRTGSLLSEADILIMSIAFSNGELLVTHDKKGFKRLKDERIIIVD
jgi:predicted nucleic acid-binding protein